MVIIAVPQLSASAKSFARTAWQYLADYSGRPLFGKGLATRYKMGGTKEHIAQPAYRYRDVLLWVAAPMRAHNQI
jgi:hypothetical protein